MKHLDSQISRFCLEQTDLGEQGAVWEASAPRAGLWGGEEESGEILIQGASPGAQVPKAGSDPCYGQDSVMVCFSGPGCLRSEHLLGSIGKRSLLSFCSGIHKGEKKISPKEALAVVRGYFPNSSCEWRSGAVGEMGRGRGSGKEACVRMTGKVKERGPQGDIQGMLKRFEVRGIVCSGRLATTLPYGSLSAFPSLLTP